MAIRAARHVEDEGQEERPMRIDAWMKHPVITVRPRDSAYQARELMERHRINQLPVVVDGHLVGIVTDRDLRDAFPSLFESAEPLAGRGSPSADPGTIPVEDVMTPMVLTLAPTATVAEAARLLRRERIGAVPIVDGSRVAGILSRSDVLEAFVELSRATPPPSEHEDGAYSYGRTRPLTI
jgi:acetoin utilization protein AcuB